VDPLFLEACLCLARAGVCSRAFCLRLRFEGPPACRTGCLLEAAPATTAAVSLLQRQGGYFSLRDALASTKWQEARLRDALGAMAREGLMLIDDMPGEGAGASRKQVWA
jgi:hypothetical protein